MAPKTSEEPEPMEVDESKKTKDTKLSTVDEELSEEDKALKESLEFCVKRLLADDTSVYEVSLNEMADLIKASTTSMTSVPKPLKFLMPHFEDIKRAYFNMVDKKNVEEDVRRSCSDIVSVLAMTIDPTVDDKEDKEKKEDSKKEESKKEDDDKKPDSVQKNEDDDDESLVCLDFKLSGHEKSVEVWGHEYLRHLSSQLVIAWNSENPKYASKTPLISLTKRIVEAQMRVHHAEAEACDLLMETEQLELVHEHLDAQCYARVCLYLRSCVPYVPEPENTRLLETTLSIYRRFNEYPQALILALQLNDPELVREIFLECGQKDGMGQKQLAFMLGRAQHYVKLEDLEEELEEYDELIEMMSNAHLNTHFLNLARELDILEPKAPEDVYKTHLDNVRPFGGGAGVDSARQNLASSFVNGFVNAAFGKDKLITEDGNKWLHKHKEAGMMSATAAIGLVLLWDVDGGLTQIDRYLYSPDEHIKAGALLACGIVNTGVRNECDPARALLSDYLLHDSSITRRGAVFGLGLAYAGTNRDEVIAPLLPVLADSKSSMEVIGVTALSLGLIAVGSCNNDVTTALLQTLIERTSNDLKDPFAKFLPLGIGLCFLGKQEAVEAMLAALEVLQEPFKSMATTMVEMCAFAGTGNVLKIQNLLHICSDHYEPSEKNESSSNTASNKKKEDSKKKDEETGSGSKKEDLDLSSQQSVAVLGLALIAMGEDIGSEMLFRTFGHLLRYCEPAIRRAVPLALGLLSVSNPQLSVLDTLSKFSHDADAEVAHNAIFAMGLAGAGTNNARLAAMLRQLAQYHAKDASNLFIVRIAQGLLHMGKGTLTLNPFHCDNQLMSPVSVAGLLGCLVAMLDVKTTLLGKAHYLLYSLAPAMQPRMLVTFDESLNPLPVSVRVGQAVDVVGQAGKPKTITGFQTHTTPVLLATGERAELATDEYLPLTPIMEGFVILKKNPDY